MPLNDITQLELEVYVGLAIVIASIMLVREAVKIFTPLDVETNPTKRSPLRPAKTDAPQSLSSTNKVGGPDKTQYIRLTNKSNNETTLILTDNLKYVDGNSPSKIAYLNIGATLEEVKATLREWLECDPDQTNKEWYTNLYNHIEQYAFLNGTTNLPVEIISCDNTEAIRKIFEAYFNKENANFTEFYPVDSDLEFRVQLSGFDSEPFGLQYSDLLFK